MNFKDLFASAIYWRLFIWKAANGCLKVGIATFIGATTAQNWSAMTPFQHVVIILTSVLAITTFLDGLIDQTIGLIKSGGKPQTKPQLEPEKATETKQ